MPRLFHWLFYGFLGRGLMITTALLAIFLIVETFDKSRYLGKGLDAGLLLEYLFLKAPFMLAEFMPVILLLAASVYVTELSRNHEVMAMRAAGLGINKIIIPLLAASGIAAMISLAIGEWVTPVTNQRLDRIEQIHIHHRPDTTSGVQWLRDGYRLFRLAPLGQNDFMVTVLETDAKGSWLKRTEASLGRYVKGAWKLSDVFISKPTEENNIDFKHEDNLTLFSAVGPDTAAPPSPRHMHSLQLWQYSRNLSRAGLSSTDYEFTLNRKLAAPLASFIMVLLSISLCTGFGNRLTSQAAGLTAAVALGLTFYILGNASGLLSAGERLPAAFAAWLPNLVFGGLAGYLLLRREGH